MKTLSKNIKLISKAVFIEKEKILAITDIHIGFEEALNKQGIFIPRTQFRETVEDIKKILKETGKLNKVIILGDLKHEFGSISQQEWKETLKFLEILEKHSKEIILIKGNHDTILGPIANKRKIEVKNFYKFKECFFCHGDKFFIESKEKEIKFIFTGHLHPAVILREGVKAEKYKCFLIGDYKKKTVIILPSFIPIIEGTNLMSSNLKLFGNVSIDNYKVYAIEDRIYELKRYKNY